MDIFRREKPAEVRQHHELDEALRIAKRMRDIGGIRPVREVRVLGITKTVPDGPDFLERVDEISNRMKIDGKRTVHTVEEIAEFVQSGEGFHGPGPAETSRYTGMSVDEEGPWDGVSRLDKILGEAREDEGR